MAWRKHKTHREETRAVKEALREAGISFKSVGHGKGTAWSWLKINLGPEAKANYQELRAQTLRVAQTATGRSGEYDGYILILTQ